MSIKFLFILIANVYLIQNTVLEISCVIHTSKGVVPDKTKKVGPVNNVLHSAFEAVRLYINDIPITKSASNYPYKSYITTTLTYSSLVKNAQLSTQGYYTDISEHMDSVSDDTNSGFTERSNCFRKDGSSTGEFKPGGTT